MEILKSIFKLPRAAYTSDASALEPYNICFAAYYFGTSPLNNIRGLPTAPAASTLGRHHVFLILLGYFRIFKALKKQGFLPLVPFPCRGKGRAILS